MRIILHGAINGENFGDFLFAYLFYDELIKNGHEVFFFNFRKIGISDFYKKYIGYDKKCTLRTIFGADALVYFSGGYFGERTKTKKEAIVRYISYFPIGGLFRYLHKKILIVGVGGAPISYGWLRKKIIKIINHASLVIFRDEKTLEYYEKYGAKKDVEATTDTAISLSVTRKPSKKNIEKLLTNKKNIFLHVTGGIETDEAIINIIAPAVNEFMETHADYNVIIGGDNVENEALDKKIKNIFPKGRAIISEYKDPWRLYDLLGNVDLIITMKLHVGIIGSSLGSSVIAFPYHPEKTKRYYQQIGESDRCIAVSDIDKDIVLEQIKKYSNNPIEIDNKIVELSRYNLDKMTEVLGEIEKNEK